jgi:NAD(P)-dependent dehydrogenase (short-subunit alcohol dehydrogenase family)
MKEGQTIYDKFSLSGRIAIITGASGQLGGEYTKTLLAAGASVAAFDINPGNPKSTIRNIQSNKLITVAVDITKKDSLQKGLQEVVDRFGDPSILINNAAIDAPPDASEQDTGPFESYSEYAWDSMIDVNLKGTFLCCQVIGDHFAKHGGGTIINISSIYGMLSPDQRIYKYRPKPFFKPVAYSVSKSGILNLTRYLATYWASQGVRVNTLTLSGVFNNQDDTFLSNYTSRVPMGRMANPDEYNGAILFLSSDASSYMTGSNLIIDGGFSSW